MNTAEALDKIFEAYNNASYDEVSKDDLSEAELADMERIVTEQLKDGPGALPYALASIMNIEDWKTWQIIQMTQELS
jgi:hypothetical protein